MQISFIEKINEQHIQPQFARQRVMLLDGKWKCNGQDICVPFPPESQKSGFVNRQEVLSDNWDGKLRYEKTFSIPKDFDQPRVLLHFGAVDQEADVYIDDKLVGGHRGGYLKFTFDITDFLSVQDYETLHILRVEVTDTLSHFYPYGKQRIDRGGMWYTKVSGIWKSVWLENVPDVYVDHLEMENDLTSVDIKAVLSDGTSESEHIEVENPVNWSPENPKLYPVRIILKDDCIDSYFALRVIGEKKINGCKRIVLNDEPVFFHGVLYQGYWPDGIYRPDDISDYDRDIFAMKELGFNTLRVHCKIEDDYFYAACDRLGMIVCQDMVQSGGYHYLRDTVLPTINLKKRRDDKPIKNQGVKVETGSQWKDAYDEIERREFFISHCLDTQKQLQNYPCVLIYTIFNEGWGQFDSDNIYEILKESDGTRLYDSTSGWFAQKKSDFDSYHIYFWYKKMRYKHLPMFLKECGGYTLPMEGHMVNDDKYGYGGYKTSEELTSKIIDMYENLVLPYIDKGLCGCIYTQLSDVEDEINGLYTFDRELCKVVKCQMVEISKKINEQIILAYLAKEDE